MKIRFKGRFNPLLKNYPFRIVDVGAREGYKKALEPLKGYLKVVGFEPEKAEFARLSRESGGDVVYVQSALSDSAPTITLHLTKNHGLASMYMPNYRFLNRFPNRNSCGYELEGKFEVGAGALDTLLPQAMKGQVDFIKIDVEGGAFDVLQGSAKTFEDNLVTGLYVEAEFNEKYCGQPLFPDVDRFLRERGFQLFDMRVCRWKRAAGASTGGSEGQPVHGGFVYFLDVDRFFERLAGLSGDEKKAKVVKFVILCCLYGNYDYAMELIQEARKNGALDASDADALTGSLSKTQGFFFRIPKLKERSVVADIFYHVFMLVAGIWLRRGRYWQPAVEL